jgi:hypothetical protein
MSFLGDVRNRVRCTIAMLEIVALEAASLILARLGGLTFQQPEFPASPFTLPE